MCGPGEITGIYKTTRVVRVIKQIMVSRDNINILLKCKRSKWKSWWFSPIISKYWPPCANNVLVTDVLVPSHARHESNTCTRQSEVYHIPLEKPLLLQQRLIVSKVAESWGTKLYMFQHEEGSDSHTLLSKCIYNNIGKGSEAKKTKSEINIFRNSV